MASYTTQTITENQSPHMQTPNGQAPPYLKKVIVPYYPTKILCPVSCVTCGSKSLQKYNESQSL